MGMQINYLHPHFLMYRNLRVLSRATFNFYSAWSGRDVGEAARFFFIENYVFLSPVPSYFPDLAGM